jgi:DNA repair exonuclease SbcCD ATPase subunit
MNQNSIPDLQIAQDLENLTQVINESIERAEKTLQQAKKVDEVNILIAKIDRSCQELVKAQQILKITENITSNQLQEAKEVEQNLHRLKEIQKQLEEIGISGNFLEELNLLLDNVTKVKKEIQTLIEKPQQIYLKAQKNLERSDSLSNESAQIKQEIDQIYSSTKLKIQELEDEINTYNQEVTKAQDILREFNFLVSPMGGLKQIRTLFQEVQNTRLELRNLQEELLSTKQQMIAVRNFENYLQDLQNIRNSRQLWKWLENELGFVGFIVYILSLISRKRKQ